MQVLTKPKICLLVIKEAQGQYQQTAANSKGHFSLTLPSWLLHLRGCSDSEPEVSQITSPGLPPLAYK